MQKLNFEQIKKIVHGVARVEEGEGKISFFRFTKEQQELYKSVSKDFYGKSFSTSGVYLEFETDTENLFLSVLVSKASSRTYFNHSIFVNSKRMGELAGNIAENENVPFEKMFKLGAGMKKVRVLFPWSVVSNLVSLEIDDNAKVIPVDKKCKVLMFGDSITQGYDASIPEKAYAFQIADYMEAEARNKGIAGELFFAKLTMEKEDLEPDFITVAYGTNDWNHCTREEFCANCGGFLSNLSRNYPNSPIFVITPIWRKELNEYRAFGPFAQVSEQIKELAAKHDNITVIDGFDFVPQNEAMFADFVLHPNDHGFGCYFDNLSKQIKAFL